MGISGLLPVLKDIQQPRHISDFEGKRLAVDAYVWLHKGAFGCAEDLVKGRRTTKFVDYAMFRVRMLKYYKIEPYIVFDGGPLPAKRGTEDSRAKSRADNLARARAFEAQGRKKDARDAYTKCVDITPEMAYQFIKALRAEGFHYVVAPYEADAQLHYLEREGFVDGVITEDSDLLVFGCKTVIFKLEKDGSCVSIQSDRLSEVRTLDFNGWTNDHFRHMAMLSGCDYLPSIQGIGLKKAHRLLRRCKTVRKVLSSIRLEGAHIVPRNYEADFAQAELAFLYQRVFCPRRRRLVMLAEPDYNLSTDDEKWIGLDLDVEIARGMALGDLHPESRKPIDDLWPNYNPSPRKPKEKGTVADKPVDPTLSKNTLDGWIQRKKPSRSMPPPIRARNEKLSSGPTMLSNLPNVTPNPLRKCHTEPASISPPRKTGTTSKFFGKRARVISEEPEEQFSFSLTYETSTTASLSQRHRSPTPEDVRSPSPELEDWLSPVSTRHGPTPQRHAPSFSDDEENDAVHFTSPVSERSGFSTPTPRKGILVDATQERPDPSSPTPTPTQRFRSSQFAALSQRFPVSLSSSSQGKALAVPSPRAPAMLPSSQRSTESEEYGDEDYAACAPRVYRPLTSVLVPASSPGLRDAPGLRQHSSDSAPDDNIVTPSPLTGMKRRRRSTTKEAEVEDEDEDEDEAEVQRAQRAKAVGGGLSARFSLDAKTFTPPSRIGPKGGFAPRRTVSTSGAISTATPAVKQVVSVSSASRVLTNQSVNVPRSEIDAPPSKPWPSTGFQRAQPLAEATPRPRLMSAPDSAKARPASFHGLTSSQLERFRYTRARQ